MKKLFFIVSVLGLMIFAGCTMSDSNSEPTADKELTTEDKLTATLTSDEPLTHNWGDINIMGGLVSHEFELENSGNEEITIKGAPTSCMCTTAQFEFEGENYSPKFSLHRNPTNWSQTVAPGEEFEVYVTFDPLAHGPDATGLITRVVFLEIEGESEPIQLKVLGNVLSKENYEAKYGTSGFEMGDFVFEEEKFDFGKIKQSGPIVSHDFKFTYNGEETVTVEGVPTSCACTTASIDKKELNKGDAGVITVEFDPNLHEEPEGKFFKSISVLTQPAQEEEVEIKIWTEIDLDLGPEAYKLKEEHID